MKASKKVASFVIILFLFFSGIHFSAFLSFRWNPILQESALESVEYSIGEIKGALSAYADRSETIRKVMEIIDNYNPALPASVKYAIANEIFEMCMKYDNLNPDLICATITHESAATWDPEVVSHKGAMGLMQIMPSTGRYLAQMENIEWTSAKKILFDPILNIRLGSRYLSGLIDIYGVEGGLAAYNGGEKRAAMWLANNKAKGILWSETQRYVPAIMRLYDHYKN